MGIQQKPALNKSLEDSLEAKANALNDKIQKSNAAIGGGLKGAPKQGAGAGKPLTASAQGGALMGAGKQGVAGKPLNASAQGGALMGAGKQGPIAGKPLTAPAKTGFKTAQPAGMKMNQAAAAHKAASAEFDNAKTANAKNAADAKVSKAQVDYMKAEKQGSTSKAPTQGQTIGTRTPARPSAPAPAKPGVSKVLPNALNKGAKK